MADAAAGIPHRRVMGRLISTTKDILVRNVLTICCACVGGSIGYLGVVLLLERGVYALILPGGLLGLAAGIVRSRSPMVAVLCGFLAVVAGLLTEHHFAPFVADRSLSYFLVHALDLQPMTLFLIGMGGVIGFWVPFRRRLRGAA
jgi:hypothetical protein